MNKDLMIEIIENVKELADDLKKEKEINDVQYGELLGYASIEHYKRLSMRGKTQKGWDLILTLMKEPGFMVRCAGIRMRLSISGASAVPRA